MPAVRAFYAGFVAFTMCMLAVCHCRPEALRAFLSSRAMSAEPCFATRTCGNATNGRRRIDSNELCTVRGPNMPRSPASAKSVVLVIAQSLRVQRLPSMKKSIRVATTGCPLHDRQRHCGENHGARHRNGQPSPSSLCHASTPRSRPTPTPPRNSRIWSTSSTRTSQLDCRPCSARGRPSTVTSIRLSRAARRPV